MVSPGHETQTEAISPLDMEIENNTEDINLQDGDDAEASSDLGKEAPNNFDDEVVDEPEDGAEEGADEATNLREETTDFNLEGHGNDGDDRGTSTKYELQATSTTALTGED